MADLDLDRLAKVAGMIGSASDNEALVAARQAERLIRAAGMAWADFILSARRAAVATKSASDLLAENTELRAENDRLRAENSHGTAVALWQDVGAVAVTDTRAAAAWALDLHRRGLVWLSDFEVPFLIRCQTWTGRLTPRMEPVFRRILDRIVERTGLRPPS